MIKRYTRPEMGALFTDQAKYDAWLDVELAVCAAWAQRSEIPRAAFERIRKKARYDIKRIDEIEAQVHHDVIAFTTSVGEYIGADSAYFHRGLTSNDVVDTAQGLILKRAGRLIEEGLVKLKAAVGARALEHKYTPCIGRTHGVHAEPTTFGLRLAVWFDELARHEERLAAAIDQLAVGKLSGAVGNFANIPPAIEEAVLKNLGLLPEPVSSQVVQRDRHAQFICTLANLAATMEKMAVNLRTLQRTEVDEAHEAFAVGQKGSSAMPHKRNPILLERITGLARVLRGYSVTALENVALWDERDISHSGAERVILPDACILMDYMLTKLSGVVEKLEVNAERMSRNIFFTKGLVFSQRVLLALTETGLSREQAYAITQRNAMRCWEDGTPLLDVLLSDRDVRAALKPQEISDLFSLEPYFKHVDTIFARAGLSQPEQPRQAEKPVRGRSERPARGGRGAQPARSPLPQGPVQNIDERASDYFENAAVVAVHAAVTGMNAGDETLGEAEHQKKRKRGAVRTPGGAIRREGKPVSRTRSKPKPAAATPAEPKAPASATNAAAPKPRRSRAKPKPAAEPAAGTSPAQSSAGPAAGAAGAPPAALAEGEQPKKRRRRGTRGGRRHKKNGGPGAPGEPGGEPTSEPPSDDSYVD